MALLFELGDNLKWLYSLLLVAGFLYYKQINSLSVTLIFLTISEWAMNHLRDPLYDYVMDLAHNEAVVIWSLTWFFFCFATIFAIQFSHKRLNLASTKTSLFVVTSYLGIMALQTIRLIDDQFLNTNWIALLYRFGVSSINISIGLVITVVLSKEMICGSRIYRRYFDG